jgi:hypothetical protein
VVTMDDDGFPTDDVLASSSWTTPHLGSGLVATFDLGTGASVVGGKEYAWVLRPDPEYPESHVYLWASFAEPCSGALYVKPQDSTQAWQFFNNSPNYDAEYSTEVSPPDTTLPIGSVLIKDDKLRTKRRTLTLTLNATDPEPASGVADMPISNNGTVWSEWEPYQTTKGWQLGRREGRKTVYVQYRDAAGNVPTPASDSIIYRR